MDPRVVAHFGGDVSLRQHQPAQARALPRAVRRACRSPSSTSGRTRRPASVDEVLAARCPGCSYTYEVAAGDEHEGFAAGTAWADVPADWCCPDCGVRDKADFVPFDPSRVVA